MEGESQSTAEEDAVLLEKGEEGCILPPAAGGEDNDGASTPSVDISLVVPPPTSGGHAEAALYRYPNPGGNFYTGLDITSEVCGLGGGVSVPTNCGGQCRRLFRSGRPGRCDLVSWTHLRGQIGQKRRALSSAEKHERRDLERNL